MMFYTEAAAIDYSEVNCYIGHVVTCSFLKLGTFLVNCGNMVSSLCKTR